MEIVEKIKTTYELVDSLKDPRVQDWPLLQSPVPTYSITLLYILFSWKIGPMLMKNRDPLQLKIPLVIFNIAMTYLNYHIFKELLFGMIDAGYSYPCQPYIHDDGPKHMRFAALVSLVFIQWGYLAWKQDCGFRGISMNDLTSKGRWWSEGSDPVKQEEFNEEHELRHLKLMFGTFINIVTLIVIVHMFFFVVRKKNNQISFLHVYHHSTMPLLWWIGAKFVPGGQSGHAAMLNAFIHIVMYSYYGLAALGPQYQKYLWWKRYLTQMQLVQFCIALTVAVYSLYIDCPFPRWMSYVLIAYMISFLVLFGNFYLQAYIKGVSKKSETVERKGEVSSNGATAAVNGQSSPRKKYELRQRPRIEK